MNEFLKLQSIEFYKINSFNNNADEMRRSTVSCVFHEPKMYAECINDECK